MSATELERPAAAKVVYKKPKIALSYLTPNNVGTVKKINSVVLPVGYSEKYYKEILDPALEDYNQLVLYNDLFVGCLTCKFEDASKPETRLYIATLGILAPYRNQGLASHLLTHLLSVASASHSGGPPSAFQNVPVSTKSLTKEKKALAAKSPALKKITGVYVHVWTGNQEGREWYEKRGFVLEKTVEDYYTKIEPKSAWVLSKEMRAEA